MKPNNHIKFLLAGCVAFSSLGQVHAAVPVIDLNQRAAAPVGAAVPIPSFSARDSLSAEERIRLLEQQVNNLTQMNISARIDNIQQQIQELNGQLELQAHNIQALTDQQRAFYQDLNQRLSGSKLGSVSKNDAIPASPSVGSSGFSVDANAMSAIDRAQANVLQNSSNSQKSEIGSEIALAGSEEKAYQLAFNLLMNKQNGDASTAFQSFLKTYPSGSYAPNAHYWLGELYSAQAQNNLAAKEFAIVIQKYPTHSKVPDAMLKLAIIHNDLGQINEAKQELQKIKNQFPNSTAARLATMHLQQLRGSS